MATSKGEATKGRILEAAVDLLVEGGPDGFNLDCVLRATRTSKGQLFHYFPGGRDELYRAATVRQAQRLVASSTPSGLDSWEGWEAWIAGVIALHETQPQDHACEVAAFAARAMDTDAATRAVIGGTYTDWIDLLAAQLGAMVAAGLLRPQTPVDQLASVVLAAMQGGAVIDKATGSRAHLGNALRQVLELLRSFRPDETGAPDGHRVRRGERRPTRAAAAVDGPDAGGVAEWT